MIATEIFPTPPGVALQAVALRRRQELDLSLEQGSAVARRMYRKAIASPSDLTEMIVGSEVLKQRARHAIAEATDEVMVLSRPPYIETDEESRALEFREGVVRRYIYYREALDAPGHLEVIERDVAAGEGARFVPRLPMKLAIVDRRAGFIAFDIRDPDVSAGVVVHPSSLLDALIIPFELLWERALPLTFPTQGGVAVPASTSDDDRLLTLLSTGLKDEAVARRLGISTRSLRRRISKLQQELGATNRFQAGFRPLGSTAFTLLKPQLAARTTPQRISRVRPLSSACALCVSFPEDGPWLRPEDDSHVGARPKPSSELAR